MKKVLLGILIALLVACIVVEGVFLYKEIKKNNDDSTKKENQSAQMSETKDEEVGCYNGKEITIFKQVNQNKPEANDDFNVRPFDAYTYEYYDVLDKLNYIAYQYNIPQIYLNTNNSSGKNLKDIEKINEEILEEWDGIIDNIKESQMMDMSKEGLEYRCYYDNGIMTLLLKTNIESGYPILKAYSIDSKNGKKLSNEELIAKFDFSEEELKTKLIESIEKYSQKIITTFEQSDNFYTKGVEDAKKQVRETALEDMNLMVLGNSDLGIYIETFNLHYAGGDTSGFLFDLSTGEDILYDYVY